MTGESSDTKVSYRGRSVCSDELTFARHIVNILYTQAEVVNYTSVTMLEFCEFFERPILED